MRKLNFEQSLPASREVGGPSAATLMVVAIMLCAVWGVLLHIGV